MREAYKEYIKEFPNELEAVVAVIRRSKDIQQARNERVKQKLALIKRIREEDEKCRNM